MPKRIQIIIVDRVQQWRFPRTKKRRIRNKWKKREENFRPFMIPVGFALLVGAGAITKTLEPSVYSETFEFSTDLWCMIAGQYPEWADRCDLFEKVPVDRNGMTYEDLVPLPWRDWAQAGVPGE